MKQEKPTAILWIKGGRVVDTSLDKGMVVIVDDYDAENPENPGCPERTIYEN